ncbi:MAG: hypothetical protein M1812_005423 [Candelaria pacifica]|nr:MAG: hypothetical protein M1812_005423 [Candelaria pacifica]
MRKFTSSKVFHLLQRPIYPTEQARSTSPLRRKIHIRGRYDWGSQEHAYQMAFERKKIEEELLPNYRPERYPIIRYYYPIDCSGGGRSWTATHRASSSMRIPASSSRDWQVGGKLGYGSQSTVWFAQDYKSTQYVAIKVLTNDSMPLEVEESEEAPIKVHLNRAFQGEPGHSHIVHLLDDYYSEQDVHTPSRAPPVKIDRDNKWR